jgi:hypothetical protein
VSANTPKKRPAAKRLTKSRANKSAAKRAAKKSPKPKSARPARPKRALTNPALERKNMVRDPAYGLSPEALEYARQRYENTDDPMSHIAADVGKSRGTLYKIAKLEGWQLREDRPPRDLSPALKLDLRATEAVANTASEASLAEDRSTDPDTPPDSIAARLEAAVEKELRQVEDLRSQSPPRGKRSAEAERVARTLATLTETLFKVRRLRQPGGSQASNDDDLPSDPDGFRLALAHRIEVFVRSRMDEGVHGPDQPADGDVPAS